MSNKKNDKEKGIEEFNYLTERIVEKPDKKKLVIRKICGTIGLAALFGVVAGFVFMFITTNGNVSSKKNEDESYITIAEDQSTEEVESGTDRAEGEILAQTSISLSQYKSIFGEIKSLVQTASDSLVTVTSLKNDVDWFNNTYANEGKSSGIIISAMDPVIILTDYASISECDRITVSFVNGVTADAKLRKADKITGLATLEVDYDSLDKKTKDRIQEATFGNSDEINQGDPILAIGNPLGYNSISTGIITSTFNYANITDSTLKLLCTDITESAEGRGFIINFDGQIVGMLTKSLKSSDMQNVATAIAISDIMPVIEKLTNNQGITYLGINGQDVTAAIKELEGSDMPFGVYVKEAIIDSPASLQGIMSGDIITKIDYQKILSMKEIKKYLESKNPGDSIKVTVKRKVKEGYKSFDYNIVLGG